MIKREEFYYGSRDGESRIHAVKWLPENGKPKAVLQICHGMAEYILRYNEFAEYLAGQGILVTGNDHLGHGFSKQENKPYGYFCKQDAATVVVRDVHRLKKMVQEENPGVPYIILGHSMGSFILRNYLAKYGTGIDGAVIVGTGNHSKLETTALKILTAVQKMFLGGEHVGNFLDRVTFGGSNGKIADKRTDSDWLSADEKNVDAYLADPLCGFTFTINGFEMLAKLVSGASDGKNIEKIPKELSVLFLSGAEDPIGNYGKAVTEVFDSFKAHGIQNVSMKLYEGDRHEILNEADRQQVYEDVLRFVCSAAE